MTQEAGQPALDIAGFWRRIGAFAIDGLILGVAGLIVGGMLFEPFARLGIYGRLLGFVIALGYFGFFNSNFLGGQTPGKKMLGLRVVNAQGQLISLPRSLARSAVLGVPFFLNNLPINMEMATSWVAYLLSLIVFGAGLSIVYLYVFNRRTRQSLHDLAVGSYVVRIAPEELSKPVLAVWQGHWVVVGLLVVLSLGGPAVGSVLMKGQLLADVWPVYQAVSVQPHVTHALIGKNTVWANGSKSHYLSASLRLDQSRVDDQDYAQSLARVMAKNFPAYTSEDAVVVELVYGYDIGIASGWKKHRYSFKPEELK